MKLIGAARLRATTAMRRLAGGATAAVLGQAYEQTVDRSTAAPHVRPLSWPSLPTFTR